MENKEEIYYFDEFGNMVSKEKAVKGIIREVDKDGNLISEQFLSFNSDVNNDLNSLELYFEDDIGKSK